MKRFIVPIIIFLYFLTNEFEFINKEAINLALLLFVFVSLMVLILRFLTVGYVSKVSLLSNVSEIEKNNIIVYTISISNIFRRVDLGLIYVPPNANITPLKLKELSSILNWKIYTNSECYRALVKVLYLKDEDRVSNVKYSTFATKYLSQDIWSKSIDISMRSLARPIKDFGSDEKLFKALNSYLVLVFFREIC